MPCWPPGCPSMLGQYTPRGNKGAHAVLHLSPEPLFPTAPTVRTLLPSRQLQSISCGLRSELSDTREPQRARAMPQLPQEPAVSPEPGAEIPACKEPSTPRSIHISLYTSLYPTPPFLSAVLAISSHHSKPRNLPKSSRRHWHSRGGKSQTKLRVSPVHELSLPVLPRGARVCTLGSPSEGSPTPRPAPQAKPRLAKRAPRGQGPSEQETPARMQALGQETLGRCRQEWETDLQSLPRWRCVRPCEQKSAPSI